MHFDLIDHTKIIIYYERKRILKCGDVEYVLSFLCETQSVVPPQILNHTVSAEKQMSEV